MENSPRSPFYHDWKDRAEAERYQVYALETFRHLKLYQEASRNGHMEYGKWLIASVLAVHGGAIYAISGLHSAASDLRLSDLVSVAAWNLGGVVMILLAGFFAWLNMQCLEAQYGRWADPAMLFRSDRFPKEDGRTDPVSATLYLSVAFGLLSLFAFVVSAVEVTSFLGGRTL